MRKLSFNEYRLMSIEFNRLTFSEKIKYIIKNKDVLRFLSDCNWWSVHVKDEEMDNLLSDYDITFDIENDWGSSEMCDLVGLLGIEIGDL